MMRRITLIFVPLLAAGCASTGAVPRPFPLPGGTPNPSSAAGAVTGSHVTAADGYAISSTALALRGAPYRSGGTDPSGFDCSGFVHYVFAQHGVEVPRETRQLFARGQEVDPSALEPGDLVFFTTVAPGASHVGIMVGGDQFIHAPSSNGVVRVEYLTSQYWASRFVGAKRLN